MFKHIAYRSVAVAAAVALSGLGAGGAGASATGAGQSAGHAAVTAATAAAIPGTQLWVQRYNGPANGNDRATSVAVSPGGGTVFVTGSRDAPNGHANYATVAYNAATGAKLWGNSYNGPVNGNDYAASLAVSPSGGTVFVTGTSDGNNSGNEEDYATVAYNAATGAQLWAKRYNGPNSNDDRARSVAVSPTGGTVFVTGLSFDYMPEEPEGGARYATVAYNAATGAQLWTQRYTGPANFDDEAAAVAVSPGGGRVFVTGTSNEHGYVGDYATVAYRADNGRQLWATTYNGPADGNDVATSLAANPAGGTVFVTGYSDGTPEVDTGGHYTTVAYNVATGAQLWATRYLGSGNSNDKDTATSVAVSPTGGTVYITGSSYGGAVTNTDYATVAYNAATGARLWAKRYNHGPSDSARSVAVSPAGDLVFVTGTSQDTTSGEDYATMAYNAATGARLRVQRYNSGPGYTVDEAAAMAVSPGGDRVFVTGTSYGATGADYVTVAYSG
jgi:WD40 repeat protein